MAKRTSKRQATRKGRATSRPATSRTKKKAKKKRPGDPPTTTRKKRAPRREGTTRLRASEARTERRRALAPPTPAPPRPPAGAPEVTPAGRERVLEALERSGLLLVQGQGEARSLADLHAGAPVTVRGYAWDYVPAWCLREELAAREDVALVKLLRGRSTLVDARFWPALEALSREALVAVRAGRGGEPARRLLDRIEAEPGITGERLKASLGLTAAEFQRTKNDLAAWLCVVSREQEEADHHTHDAAWFPWSHGKVARAVGHLDLPVVHAAVQRLLAALVLPAGPRPPRPASLLPVLKLIEAT